MQILRQSTAKTVVLGPFVDATDGVTAETALTIAQADIRLSKNGGAFAQTNNAAGATAMENGYYSVPLDTTDTGTVGTLTVAVSESGALPVWREFQIVEEAVFDAFYAASAGMAVTLATGAITATVIATGAIDADAIADNAIDAGAIAADAITATKIADGAITAAKIATGAIDADALAADAAAEIADAVWDEDATGHQTGGTFGQAIGDPGADTNTIFGAVVTGAAGATIAADIIDIEGKVDDLETRVGTPSDLGGGASLAANLSDIEAQTDDIGAAGAGLTAVTQHIDTEVAAIKTVTDKLDAAQSEPGQGAPAANATPIEKIGYLYKAWRNKKTQTADTFSLFADDGTTVDQKSTTSDDGSTTTVGEMVTGA